MGMPNFAGFEALLGDGLATALEAAWREGGKARRKRKLGALGLVWLCLAAALDSGMRGLEDIILKHAAGLGKPGQVTAAAFAKARRRLPPQGFPAPL